MLDNYLEQLMAKLPPIEHIKLRSEADCYGIANIVSREINLPITPRSSSDWQHGWVIQGDVKYIEQLTGITSAKKHLVALDEQEVFLRKNGIKSKAVGAPFTYIEGIDTQIERQANSLLVMPPHGMPYTNVKWDEETYVKNIDELKKYFDLIVACVHQSCVKKNNWIGTFKKYSIPWVCGAEMHDKNALIRMHRIFKSFEYMTTNTVGSHIAYAAYSGCKVSIYGKYCEFSKEVQMADVAYIERPEMLDHNLLCASEQAIKTKFPFLFVHPKNATENRKWAYEQLGANNKVSFYELAKHLGWLPHDQLYFFTSRVCRKLKKEFLCAINQ